MVQATQAMGMERMNSATLCQLKGIWIKRCFRWIKLPRLQSGSGIQAWNWNKTGFQPAQQGLLHANGRKLKLLCNGRVPAKADLVAGNKNRKPVQNFAEGKDRPCVCLSRRRQQVHTAL